ncbi:MAG: secretin [Betaproteobacteria bacterium RBG_16_58_11]|nr:MAG: secretin [Betaproteobacteria bacterium RBG_16_58_11]
MNITQQLYTPFIRIFAAALMVAISLPVSAQETAPNNGITGVDYTVQQGGKVVITVGLKQALQTPPAGFTVNNPPRIALDFMDTANQWGKNSLVINEGAMRSVNVVQSGGRTRLVLNLSRPTAYETRSEGNQFIISLQGGTASAVVANNTAQFAEAKDTAATHSLRDVDFRRGKNGEGRVVVDLSDTSTGIDIRQQGKNLVIDFLNTAVPRNLERRMDVTDYGTPVLTVDTFSQGKNARITVEPKGEWEHSAYQSDKQFIVDIKPLVEDPSKAIRAKKYTGEKLSLNFQNVEVRAVLQVIADFTGLNIITSDTVTGNLTLRLKDVPWDQALDIILQSKGLSMRKNGTVVWIAPSDELATKEKLELESKQQILDLEPLRTETFHLKFQRAENFVKVLTDDKQRILSKRGSAVIDPRTNTLFIQDTPTKMDEIRLILAQIDVPVKQVMIESRIVEATDSFSKNLGIRLGLHDSGGTGYPVSSGGSTRLSFGGQIEDPGYHTGQAADVPTFNEQQLNVNMAAGAIGGFRSGALSFVLFKSVLGRFLNLELSALQADGRGKIISNPRVVTADQMEATIEQGTEIPYQQATSSGATSVSFKKAVLSLKVKPQITPDDNVIMDLRVNKDSRGADTVSGPAIDTKQITTQVLVENGGTVVIGGIYTEDERTTVTKIPVFGDLPFIGPLFKNTQKRDDKTELLIFVTPRILKDTLNLR